jgi:uncharacterized heparinase superfamily protein
LTLAAKGVRYWHTLRHLKPVQFYGRLWFKFRQPKVDALDKSPSLRERNGQWQAPVARKTSMLGPRRFKFLSVEHDLPVQGGWNDDALEKLWLYNLHYFEDLNAEGAHGRTAWHLALLQRWVAENPLPSGNGWEPYPTSLRIVNWVKWVLAGNTVPAGCVQSLATQTRWLCKRLEVHLLGNHLFANAKSLVFAGLYFEGPEARQWLAKGLDILARELPEQVLPDGGNFERSPMYHAIFLEDLLDLLNIAGAYVNRVPTTLLAQWRDATLRMLDWLQGMTHPDGQIASFNDAAFGIAATAGELAAYAGRVLGTDAVLSGLPRRSALCNDEGGLHLRQWADSGYIRLQCTNAIALLDVAPIGPDYLPGHAHADTLSFELSLYGQRVVTNGGTSEYGTGAIRQIERGTAAHSTVTINGENSSEVWGGFRVSRRAYPQGLSIEEGAEYITVCCSHTGYRHLIGKPVHHREWQWSESGLKVTDTVTGITEHAVARFHLHPDVQVVESEADCWKLALFDGQIVRIYIEQGAATLEKSNYAPEFGKRISRACLAVALIAQRSQVRFLWETSH